MENAENLPEKNTEKLTETPTEKGILPQNPLTQNPENLPKKGIKLELVIAFLSLFISIFTFVITALQTQIMQRQQKASVWAYLEPSFGITNEGFYADVQNKGVGASIVKEVSYFVGNKKFKDFADLAKYIVNDTNFNYEYYSTNPINKKVFAPTEKIHLFRVKDMKYASKLVKQEIEVEIVYTNIYGDEFVYKSMEHKRK